VPRCNSKNANVLNLPSLELAYRSLMQNYIACRKLVVVEKVINHQVFGQMYNKT